MDGMLWMWLDEIVMSTNCSCRSKELGAWGLSENLEYLDEQATYARGFMPTANLSEVLNGTFWVKVGGKGPYLTRADALMEGAASAEMQMVLRKHWETTRGTGLGPNADELAARADKRLDRLESAGEKRRLSVDLIAERVEAAGATTTPMGGGGVTSRVSEAGNKPSEKGIKDGSTHRFDRERVDVRKGSRVGGRRGLDGKGSEKNVVEKERSMYFEELAIKAAQGLISLKELIKEEYAGVMDMQKRAHKAKAGGDGDDKRDSSEEDRGGGDDGSESGSVRAIFDNKDTGEIHKQYGFLEEGGVEGSAVE
jgi:hypothetical protein